MSRNRTHIIISSLLFVIITGSYIVMALKFPIAYIKATFEDFYGEWAQVFLFAAVFILSLKLAFARSRFRIFFILLALACFFTFMEEISWGQRIFDIQTPDFFKKHNLQGETNLHNFLMGPYSTTNIFMECLLSAGFLCYGLVYPAALALRVRFAEWIYEKGLFAPPLYLWPYFVLSAVLEFEVFSFNEAEIAEILIPFAISIALLNHMFENNRGIASDTGRPKTLDGSGSRRLALAICGIFLFAAVSSAWATSASYASPRFKNGMETRLIRGTDAFAERYKTHEIWDTAIYLYKIIDHKEPNRPHILRRIAFCYGKIGNAEKERDYLERAFDLDLMYLEQVPSSIPANISVALSYIQVGNITQDKYFFDIAESHRDRALEYALIQAKEEPESADAAYWLGSAYSEKGDLEAALTYFRKAFELEPYIMTYRKAYINTMNLIKENNND